MSYHTPGDLRSVLPVKVSLQPMADAAANRGGQRAGGGTAREALLRVIDATMASDLYDTTPEQMIDAVARELAEKIRSHPDARKYGRGKWAADLIAPER